MASITERLLGVSQEEPKKRQTITERLLSVPGDGNGAINSNAEVSRRIQPRKKQSILDELLDGPQTTEPANANGQTPELRSPSDFAGTPEIGKLDLGDIDDKGIFNNAIREIGLAAGMLFSFTPEQRKGIIKSILPQTEFEELSDGSTIVKIGENQFFLNKPGISEQDLVPFVAQMVAFGGVGKLFGLGKAFQGARTAGAARTAAATKVGATGVEAAAAGRITGKEIAGIAGRAGIADAATTTALDATTAALGSGEGIDPVRAGEFGAIGAGVTAAIPVIGKIPAVRRGIEGVVTRTRQAFGGAPVEATAENAARVRETGEATEATGIELFSSQRTGVPSDLERQRFVAELPGGSQIAFNAIERQNQQVSDAVQRLIEMIAPAGALSTGAKRFRTAVQKAVDIKLGFRKVKTSPIFQQAFGENIRVQVIDVIASLDAQIARYGAGTSIKSKLLKFRETLARENKKPVRNTLTGAIRREPGIDLQVLHNIRTEISEFIAIAAARGNIGPTLERELVILNNSLRDAGVGASATYGRALEEFARLSPAIDRLRGGIIGEIAGATDQQLKNISGRIFDAAQTNSTILRFVRRMVDKIDPGAYDDLLRIEFERRLGSLREGQSLIANIPGQIRSALFGNARQRAVLFNALRPVQKEFARLLDKALQAASSGRPGGSQTASRQEVLNEIKGGFGAGVRRLLTFDITKPLAGLSKVAEKGAIVRRAEKLAEKLYDPSFTGDIEQILKLEKSGKTAEALRLFAALILREQTPEQDIFN